MKTKCLFFQTVKTDKVSSLILTVFLQSESNVNAFEGSLPKKHSRLQKLPNFLILYVCKWNFPKLVLRIYNPNMFSLTKYLGLTNLTAKVMAKVMKNGETL